LTNKVFYAVAQLSSIQEDIEELWTTKRLDSHTMVDVCPKLRDLRNELSSALLEAHDAFTTEHITSGKTSGSTTKNDIPDLTEANVQVKKK
jgi:hypothetical protein